MEGGKEGGSQAGGREGRREGGGEEGYIETDKVDKKEVEKETRAAKHGGVRVASCSLNRKCCTIMSI